MNDQILRALKNPAVIWVTISVTSFSAGYIVGKNRKKQMVYEVPPLDKYFDTSDLVTKSDFPVGVSAPVEKVITIIHEDDEPDVTISETVHEIEGWDYDQEIKTRSSDAPYVLHRDEFFQDELNYTQITLTYYSGDDIMVDDDDTPIYNHNQIIGTVRFGHGSGDENIFYVRNDKLRAEYEVVNDPRMYSSVVLGLEIEDNARTKDLQHSGPRRFREE